MKKIIATICVLSLIVKAKSQDPQYSQYFANPLTLNPAFAGSTEYHRFSAAYRMQWPELPRTFTNFSVGYDVALPDFNSGVGVIVSSDRAGSGNLNSTGVEFIYSYSASFANKWIFQPAISFGILSRTLDYQRLLFGDQIDFGVPGSPTVDPTASQVEGANAIDIGTGFLFYGERLWLGAAYYHLNRPNVSLLREVNRLPRKMMIHAGARFPIRRSPLAKGPKPSIMPSILYKMQGEFTQLDVGVMLNSHPVSVGAFYRGAPFVEDVEGRVRNEAMVFMFAIQVKGLDVGYSYDVNIARLGPETGGAHEVTLQYRFKIREKPGKIKRKNARLPCPAFLRDLPM